MNEKISEMTSIGNVVMNLPLCSCWVSTEKRWSDGGGGSDNAAAAAFILYQGKKRSNSERRKTCL